MNLNLFFKNITAVIPKIKRLLIRDVIKDPVINHFKTKHDKNVLLSYVTAPFKKGLYITHTNAAEAMEIAEIFNELGYNADIAEFNYEGFIDYNKYDVIFGFGEPLVRSFYLSDKYITRIYYGTGMHISVQNYNTLRRIKEVKNKKGKYLPGSGRIVERAWSEQSSLSDAIIVLGNETAAESFRKNFTGEIYTAPASFIKVADYKNIIEQKNFDEAKKHFVWFGSRGFIHKGLDILLEIFKENTDIHLHVFGPIDEEPEFKKVYYDELYKTENIHTHGFVKVDSEKFKELLQKCGFVIYPTSSEGGSPSVLNVSANGGLIPILTKEATLDVGNFGFTLNSVEKNEIKNVINSILKLNNDELKKRSLEAGNFYTKNHSLGEFTKTMKENLATILKVR